MQRTAKWDNLKAILIFCVVLGHLSFHFLGNYPIWKGIYFFIYSFHMPLFLFLSGMFSKTIINNKQWERIFPYFMLYLIMKTLEFISKYIVGTNPSYHFFWGSGPSWYVFAVGVFLILTIFLKKIQPQYMIIAFIIIGILAGMDNHLGQHFSSMRLCVFYPFFLLGYYTNPQKLQKTDTRYVIPLLGCILLCFLFAHYQFNIVHLLKGKYPYNTLHMPFYYGCFLRICFYLFSLLIGYCIICLIPNKRIFILSYVGENSLPIYVWHIFIYNLFFGLEGKELLLKLFPHYVPIFTFGILTIAICINPLFYFITDAILHPHKNNKL